MGTETLGGSVPDPRDRNLPADRRILAAAHHLLLDEGHELLRAALSRKRLAAMTGQSRQTVYRHYPEDDALLVAVLHEGLRPEHAEWVVETSRQAISAFIAASPADSVVLVRELSRAQYEGLESDDYWPLSVTVWATGRHLPQVRDELAATWTWLTDELEDVYDQLRRHWDAEVTGPWTTRRLSHVIGALAEGLVLRGSVLDEVDADLFADAVLTLTEAVVRPHATEEGRPEPLPNTPPIRPLELDEVERAVLTALEQSRGARSEPTIEQLAAWTGLPVRSLRIAFADGGLPRALGDRLIDRLQRHADGLDRQAPPLENLRVQLDATARSALAYPTLASRFLQLLTGWPQVPDPTGEQTVAAAARPLETLLRQARQTGEVRYSVTAALLARHVLGTLLGQALLWAGSSEPGPAAQAAVVDATWRLTLAGPVIADD